MTESAALPSIDGPLYGASFGQAIARFFRRYVTFSGRASRSEYWWVFLFNAIVLTVLVIASTAAGATATSITTGAPPAAAVPFVLILAVYLVGTLLPTIALTMRRLHDANFSGWLVLIHFVPYVGSLAIMIFALLKSNPIGARFDTV